MKTKRNRSDERGSLELRQRFRSEARQFQGKRVQGKRVQGRQQEGRGEVRREGNDAQQHAEKLPTQQKHEEKQQV